MQDLSITLVQPDQKWEDKEANFANYERLLSDVDTDLILLPEMFQTGFGMDTSQAEEMTGQSVSWLRNLASEKNAAVYTSLMINENGANMNRGIFVTPDELHTYDKRKVFGMAKEDEYFQPGQEEIIVAFRGWKFQLQICYDLRFPEIARNGLDPEGNPNYDVLLYVANWPEKRIMHWDALLQARAIENQCYVAACNRTGLDGNGFSYVGHSQLIDAMGNCNKLPAAVETCQTFVINGDNLSRIREMLPFLKDR